MTLLIYAAEVEAPEESADIVEARVEKPEERPLEEEPKGRSVKVAPVVPEACAAASSWRYSV